MCSVTLGRHCIHHVIQEIKFMGNKEENLKLCTCLALCVHYSLSTPLLRRFHCELTSFNFSFDRAVFLCLWTPSKNISILFHVHVVHFKALDNTLNIAIRNTTANFALGVVIH